jgi:hypothetical protein
LIFARTDEETSQCRKNIRPLYFLCGGSQHKTTAYSQENTFLYCVFTLEAAKDPDSFGHHLANDTEMPKTGEKE